MKTISIILKYMLALLALAMFVWAFFIVPLGAHPFLWMDFKSAIKKGKMEIEKRDTLPMSNQENVYMKNAVSGMRYKLLHEFENKKDFQKSPEDYRMVIDVNGEMICWKGDDEQILKFLNLK